MSGAPYLICDAHVVSPGWEREGAAVEIRNGRIAAVHPAGRRLPAGIPRHDAGGMLLLPGFIDIHTHGAAGHDVCDAGPDSLREIARAKIREGVTTFLPTSLTLPAERLEAAFRSAAPYMAAPDYAKAPAFHVEGPFINPSCVGAQNPSYVRLPDAEEILKLHAIAPVALVSLAVEMPGALACVRRLGEEGIVTSCAHSAATWSQFREARAAGLQHLTHFCNQMTPLHHREIGLVGAGLLDETVRIEVICDGIHLCPEMLEIVFRHIGPGRLMLITDSVAASWLPDGPTTLGGLPAKVEEGVVRLENGALAGSTLRFHRALRNVCEMTGLPLAGLVQATGLNQARSLGLGGVGEIHEGFAADLVLLDADLEPQAVWVDGRELLASGAV